MESMLIIGTLALAVGLLLRRPAIPARPQVIYVPLEADEPGGGLGCLPLLLLGALVVFALYSLHI